MLLTRPIVPGALTLSADDVPPFVYYSTFQLSPPTPATNAIAGPGPQTVQYRQQHNLDDEPFMPPATYDTAQSFIAENPAPGLALQPTERQSQPFASASFMDNLYSFDTNVKPSDGGGGEPRGPEN